MGTLSQYQEHMLGLFLLCSVLAVVLIFFERRNGVPRQVRIYRRVRSRLEHFDFFHTLLVGSSKKYGRTVDGCSIWSDAYYTVVLKNNDLAIAVVGFDLTSDEMIVRQLQGIKGRKIRGAAFAPFLLSCAEHIGRALGKKVIRVQSAHRHLYFEPQNEESDVYKNMYAHQTRMQVLYDRTPEEAGYIPDVRGGRVVSRYKLIGKKLTFRRWLSLQILLFNRQAKQSRAFMGEYVQDT